MGGGNIPTILYWITQFRNLPYFVYWNCSLYSMLANLTIFVNFEEKQD